MKIHFDAYDFIIRTILSGRWKDGLQVDYFHLQPLIFADRTLHDLKATRTPHDLYDRESRIAGQDQKYCVQSD